MANVSDYVKNYGHISFRDKPFTDEDNVAMGVGFYMPLDKVVSPSFDDEPKPFGIACRELFAYRGGKHKPVGLVLVKGISRLLMDMAARKRYGEMKVVACTDNYGKEPAVQFNAGTFLLPTGEIVVIFRGTDDTLIGWKEDVDMLGSPDGIPSEKLSVDYLTEAAKHFDGDIIVSGHSKGGYVALHAVLNAPKEVRDRVKVIYNNDGPGFRTYDYINSEAYKEILPRYRHIIPRSSFIGMMLSHDDDYTVVKANRITGAMQHDMLSWQFNGDKLITCDDTSAQSKVADLVFHEMVRNLTEEQLDALETAIGEIIEATGQRGLLDVKENLVEAVRGGYLAAKELDDETKSALKETAKKAGKTLKDAVQSVRSGDYKTVKQRIED
ncbi:MAG: DUF2974 domain-containing protein [Eubacterium sp.]|nr:DUF2974 domain-containing protein [Eubacterium sp.]